MRKWVWVGLLVAGCSSAPPSHLTDGLRLASVGKTDQARGALLEACREKHPTACFLVGKTKPQNLRPVPILQGVTTANLTEINVLSEKDENLQISLWDLKALKSFPPIKEKIQGFPDSQWVTQTLRFEGLSPEATYTLVVLEEGELRDQRKLRTLPLTKKTARIAVASCMFDQFGPIQKQMWQELASMEPDLIWLIGDNVYTDFEGEKMGIQTTPAILWRRYSETRSRLQIFFQNRLIPTLAVWDDHDYGINDGGRDYPHKKAAKRTFEAFFPQSPVKHRWESGVGVGGKLTAFGQEFYFLDNRSFRSPTGSVPQTHFGEDQEKWLWAHLKTASSPVWLISGDQFFGAYHKRESFERLHPNNFKTFLASLRRTPQPVVFVSGDRHLLEVMKIEKKALGYSSVELTTSSIHAKTFPGAFKKLPNRRRIGGADNSLNYLLLETQANKSHRFTATGYGPKKKILFKKAFTVSKSRKAGP